MQRCQGLQKAWWDYDQTKTIYKLGAFAYDAGVGSTIHINLFDY